MYMLACGNAAYVVGRLHSHVHNKMAKCTQYNLKTVSHHVTLYNSTYHILYINYKKFVL